MLRTLLTIGAMQFITMLVMLVRTKVLAVTQGPEFVGSMAVIDRLLAVIVQTLSLSLPYAALRFLPERWKASPSEYRRLFTSMRNLLLALILTATIVALGITAWQPTFWGADFLPYRDALMIALLGLPAIALVPFLQNAVAGRLQQHRAMGVAFLHAVVLAIAVAGAWWGGLSGYYAVYAVTGALLVFAVARAITQDLPAPVKQAAPLGPLGLPPTVWRFGSYLIVITFLAPYAALFVYYRLLQAHGAEVAGWMQAAVGIGLSVRAVLGSAHPVFLTPNVNTGEAPVDRMRWADNFQMLFCLLAGLSLPPLLLFPDIAIRLLYASSFAPGAAFVLLFVGIEVLTLLAGTYQALVVALDRMKVHVANNLIAQALVVLVAWRLVRPMGILGAGLAGLVAPVYLLVATMFFLHRAYGLRMSSRALARTVWLIAALAGAGVLGALTRGTPFQAVPLKTGVYLVIVLGFFVLLTSEERSKAWHLTGRRGPPWG